MTTATVDDVLIDTNVLLEATDERRRYHADAVALLESRTALTMSAQVIREYLAVATRPVTANGLGVPMADALANIQEFRQNVRLLPEERPILPSFLGRLARVPCSGKRVHDAHIVATAIAHRVGTIVSLNPDDLSGFSEDVAVITPSQALGDRGSMTVREPMRRWRRTARRARSS